MRKMSMKTGFTIATAGAIVLVFGAFSGPAWFKYVGYFLAFVGLVGVANRLYDQVKHKIQLKRAVK